jgi:TonB family protein
MSLQHCATLIATVVLVAALTGCAQKQAIPKSATGPATTNSQGQRGCAPSAEDYPPEARQPGQQGTCRVKFTISAAGVITQAIVVASSGHIILDTKAVEVLSRCQFSPAVGANGNPIERSFEVEYVWKLQ